MNFRIKYQASPDVFTKIINGRTYLLKSHTDHMHELNDSAAVAWSCLQKETSAEQIVGKVASIFDVSADQALIDVNFFLRDYLKRGMIEEVT